MDALVTLAKNACCQSTNATKATVNYAIRLCAFLLFLIDISASTFEIINSIDEWFLFNVKNRHEENNNIFHFVGGNIFCHCPIFFIFRSHFQPTTHHKCALTSLNQNEFLFAFLLLTLIQYYLLFWWSSLRFAWLLTFSLGKLRSSDKVDLQLGYFVAFILLIGICIRISCFFRLLFLVHSTEISEDDEKNID